MFRLVFSLTSIAYYISRTVYLWHEINWFYFIIGRCITVPLRCVFGTFASDLFIIRLFWLLFKIAALLLVAGASFLRNRFRMLLIFIIKSKVASSIFTAIKVFVRFKICGWWRTKRECSLYLLNIKNSFGSTIHMKEDK